MIPLVAKLKSVTKMEIEKLLFMTKQEDYTIDI